ncbi:MAG: hypothetical protein KKD01_18005 [Proteobacteria bacterium]|nr:hypothetical protein [Pseudomonadota bacterium]
MQPNSKLNKTFFCLLLGLAIVFSGSQIAQAKRFHKDGREIEIMWKQKGKELHAWGKITGGEETCKQMNYEISFRNSETSSSARVMGYINNYRPNGRNNFNADVDIYLYRRQEFVVRVSKNAWYVRNYSIDCLN